MADPWTPDRRRARRRPLPFALNARMRGEADPMAVRELGTGGMVIESARPLMVGTSLEITLDNGAQIIERLQGHVAHSRLILAMRVGDRSTCLSGVSFRHLTPDQSADLARLIADVDRPPAGRSQDAP